MVYISTKRNQIRQFGLFKVKTIDLSELIEIKFHYHAVVGYIAVWEFIDRNNTSLTIDQKEIGIKKVLGFLENNLDGFSLKDFDRMFKEGDVEDTLDIWKAI